MLINAPEPDRIYQGDCLKVMRGWPDGCVDHCIADPPFGIASGSGRRSKRGLGWAFSSHVTMQETWDRFSQDEFFAFNVAWLTEVCRVVRPNGNIFVFGTFHNIYQLGFILQSVLNRRILNSIVWYKPNAQPNITARMLTESTEQIIWAVNETPQRAANWTFNYRLAKELSDDKQMRTLWGLDDTVNVISMPIVPKSVRKHPSQKPLQLIDRLTRLATKPNDLILDPFGGSGVVGLSALRYRRKPVLIELLPEYVSAAEEIIQKFPQTKRGKLVQCDGGLEQFKDEELDLLTEIPVPQADDLDLVFRVPEYVHGGAITRAQVASKLDARKPGYVGRQGPYYADAAMSLGLVQAVGAIGKISQILQITPLGIEWLGTHESNRPALQRKIVLDAPIIKYVASELGVNLDTATNVTEVLGDLSVAKVLEDFGLSENTASRRATTLCGWLKKITEGSLPF